LSEGYDHKISNLFLHIQYLEQLPGHQNVCNNRNELINGKLGEIWPSPGLESRERKPLWFGKASAPVSAGDKFSCLFSKNPVMVLQEKINAHHLFLLKAINHSHHPKDHRGHHLWRAVFALIHELGPNLNRTLIFQGIRDNPLRPSSHRVKMPLDVLPPCLRCVLWDFGHLSAEFDAPLGDPSLFKVLKH
jgi:hypothetical protein